MSTRAIFVEASSNVKDQAPPRSGASMSKRIRVKCPHCSYRSLVEPQPLLYCHHCSTFFFHKPGDTRL